MEQLCEYVKLCFLKNGPYFFLFIEISSISQVSHHQGFKYIVEHDKMAIAKASSQLVLYFNITSPTYYPNKKTDRILKQGQQHHTQQLISSQNQPQETSNPNQKQDQTAECQHGSRLHSQHVNMQQETSEGFVVEKQGTRTTSCQYYLMCNNIEVVCDTLIPAKHDYLTLNPA